MNYKVITDKDVLLAFIDWLPELAHDETFYLCLFARSKYCKHIAHIKSDKAQLKRFTSNKERLLNKITQLECPLGSYTTKESGGGQIAAPQESLALYITINPRSFSLATRRSLHKLVDLISQPYNGFHPHQEVMSEIQRAKSKTRFVSFDFDIDKNTWNEVWLSVCKIINPNAVTVVETRGGFHLIVRTSLVEERFVKSWYKNMRFLLADFSDDLDNAGDIMLPVPGTYQGGFTPKFL